VRLWSLHPSYLDNKGLVALWREGLLARKVLKGRTKGYRHHSQLIRFKSHPNPVNAIEWYLRGIYKESMRRGFHFNAEKLSNKPRVVKMKVTDGQLRFEFEHLKRKLKQRDRRKYVEAGSLKAPQAHPIFKVKPGPVEKWERGWDENGVFSLPKELTV
jgi:hypothetical protein